MRTSTGHEETSLVDLVGAAFASIFGAHEHLDMLFIRDDQEKAIREGVPGLLFRDRRRPLCPLRRLQQVVRAHRA
jgi:hypothetical protein